LDPSSSDEDVKHAAAALVVLGDPSVLPQVQQFFAMYRGSADNSVDLAEAIVSAAQVMVKHGDANDLALVQAAASDGMTMPAARQGLEAIVSEAAKENAVDAGAAGDASTPIDAQAAATDASASDGGHL
jgi:hypothetical protein